MKFSYLVNHQPVLESVEIPFTWGEGGTYLFTGRENVAFGLIGGIVAKLFPLHESIDIKPIQLLLDNYTGVLRLENGRLPNTAAYLSADPDRHFLFATVREEMLARFGSSFENNFVTFLANFGLNAEFLNRKIIALSGGEKMKVALALTFAQAADCYVLHGILPWLDKPGRELLFDKVKIAAGSGATIIFLEHEVCDIARIAKRIFIFDGRQLVSVVDYQEFAAYINNFRLKQKQINLFAGQRSAEKAKVLELNNIVLKNHPFSERKRKNDLLAGVSFAFNLNTGYVLVGDNGAGKSTIAQLIFRVFSQNSGEINFQNQPINAYTRKELNNLICYVAQFTARQITQSTIAPTKIKAIKNNNQLALELLKKYLNLPDNYPITKFSFLELKILGLINFISPATKLIILDEPTWGIDDDGLLILLQILSDIAAHINFALLIISHDLHLSMIFDAKILWLNLGKLKVFNSINEFANDTQAKNNFNLEFLD